MIEATRAGETPGVAGEVLGVTSEILDFGTASAKIAVIDNLIYVHVSGIYSDQVALKLLQHLDGLIDQIPDSPIRVWDSSGIPAESFPLSSQCVDRIAEWAKQVKARKPRSMAYMVGSSTISYGMARMYEAKADLGGTGVVVLRSLDELPPAIREKLAI